MSAIGPQRLESRSRPGSPAERLSGVVGANAPCTAMEHRGMRGGDRSIAEPKAQRDDAAPITVIGVIGIGSKRHRPPGFIGDFRASRVPLNLAHFQAFKRRVIKLPPQFQNAFGRIVIDSDVFVAVTFDARSRWYAPLSSMMYAPRSTGVFPSTTAQ